MSTWLLGVGVSGRLCTTMLHFLLSLSDISSATLIATDDGVKAAGNSQAGGLGWASVDSMDLAKLFTLFPNSILFEDKVDSTDLAILLTLFSSSVLSEDRELMFSNFFLYK